MTFADVLLWAAVPFVCATIYFGKRKGENNYYDSDDYDDMCAAFPARLEALMDAGLGA